MDLPTLTFQMPAHDRSARGHFVAPCASRRSTNRSDAISIRPGTVCTYEPDAAAEGVNAPGSRLTPTTISSPSCDTICLSRSYSARADTTRRQRFGRGWLARSFSFCRNRALVLTNAGCTSKPVRPASMRSAARPPVTKISLPTLIMASTGHRSSSHSTCTIVGWERSSFGGIVSVRRP